MFVFTVLNASRRIVSDTGWMLFASIWQSLGCTWITCTCYMDHVWMNVSSASSICFFGCDDRLPAFLSNLCFAIMECMCDIWYIYHDFVWTILVYRRVFKITVSNVSNVSILYFIRVYTWHVWRHRTVSCVQNQAMYTLWWMNCNMAYMGNEHAWCSFSFTCRSVRYALCCWIDVSDRCNAYAIWLYPHRMCDMCDIRVISTMMLCSWFLYKKEFSILPCPTCRACQTYILVGLSADTFADTLMCQVSEIGVCIRYDGWCAK